MVTMITVPRTGYSSHLHEGSLLPAAFAPPPMLDVIKFTQAALAASIARTSTLISAPQEMLDQMSLIAALDVELMVDDEPLFTVLPAFGMLGDTGRSGFPGRIGAGITDIVMNHLGYTWRDNAECLSAYHDAHPDFIYDSGKAEGLGVVVAEAHGAFSKSVDASYVTRQGIKKYNRQIKDFVGTDCRHGAILHGYSVAFGSNPKEQGAFLHIAESDYQKSQPNGPGSWGGSRGPSAESPQGPPTSLVLSSHRSNFSLMGASRVAGWIDYLTSDREVVPDTRPVDFLTIAYDGMSMVIFPFPYLDEFGYPFWWEHVLGETMKRRQLMYSASLRAKGQANAWFAMEERAVVKFLNFLSDSINSRRASLPPTLQMPSFTPVGLISDEGAEKEGERRRYNYALYRDGLALLIRRPKEITGLFRWNPKDGVTKR